MTQPRNATRRRPVLAEPAGLRASRSLTGETGPYRPLLKPLGLACPQFVVMAALWQHGSLVAGAPAQAVSLDSGTLLPLFRTLVTQGLLLRQRSSVDDARCSSASRWRAAPCASAPTP